LQISKTTYWIADTNTAIVLNNLGFENNAVKTLLSNTFYFTGNSNSSISGDSISYFRKIILNKTNNAKLVLQQNIKVNQLFDFTSGLADLNGFICYLDSIAFLQNENENNHFEGNAGGYIEIIQTLNNPINTNAGNLGATISSSQNLGNTTIRRGHQQQNNVNNTSASIYRYYEIIPVNNSLLNATLEFHYLNAELAAASESDLKFYKSTNFTNWTYQGVNTIDTFQNTLSLNGIADFSVWTLADSSLPLAIQNLLLTGNCKNGKANLQWTSALQKGVFYIEQSDDGRNWQVVEKINVVKTNTSTNYYSEKETEGSFYRVSALSNEKTYYSNVVKIECKEETFCSVYPNPTSNYLTISISALNATVCNVKITDLKGAFVNEEQYLLKKGENKLSLSFENLAAGTYMLHIQSGADKTFDYKIIKN